MKRNVICIYRLSLNYFYLYYRQAWHYTCVIDSFPNRDKNRIEVKANIIHSHVERLTIFFIITRGSFSVLTFDFLITYDAVYLCTPYEYLLLYLLGSKIKK